MTTPSFMIVGAQKAGTTNMWWVLDQHPQIAMTPAKELHYFERNSDYPDHEWYRDQFESDGRLTGEATPSYCFWPYSIERMYEFDPDMKIIMLLRNPVHRAISQYWMEFIAGHEKLPPFQGLMTMDARESSEHARGLQHTLYHHSYLIRGAYYAQLNRLHEYFPADHIHVSLLEDYVQDHIETTRSIACFLGIAEEWEYDPQYARKKGDYTLDTVDEETIEFLREYYRVPNEMLASEYGVAIEKWS